MVDKKKNVAISINNIHKNFILPQNKNSTLKQTVVNIVKKNKKVTQEVLNGVSFDIYKGDFFGVIGRNGSGKSTLLKLIAGVYAPTAGYIDVNGGLTPFIELGVGFNPELSGRDNVYLNGALLGFDRKQMHAMYDDIVEFAELEPFMDQKLKNYSSGMQVRLAFSIAIKAHNEILIFDEVLAVGDEAFQRKCLDTFERYKASGQTVVLVTHDMSTVKQFCNRAALIDNGKVVEIGNPYSVAEHYSDINQNVIDDEINSETKSGSKRAKYLDAYITDCEGNKKSSFSVGDDLNVYVSWNDLNPDNLESIGVNIFKLSGEHICGFNTRFSNQKSNWKELGKIGLDVTLNITPGSYYLLIEAFKKEGIVEDVIINGPRFSVRDDNIQWSGLAKLPAKWIDAH